MNVTDCGCAPFGFGKDPSGNLTAGVSVVSWSAYLLSAILWFWYGLQKRDKNIYLPCVGWVGLDAAVIVGAVIYA